MEVWPENWPAFLTFCELQTQWRAGPSGVIGLDYNTLFHKLDRKALSPDEYEQWEADLRVLEFAALDAMNEKQE